MDPILAFAKNSGALGEKSKHPYPDDIKKRKAVRYGSDQKGFVVDGGSGDVLGVGAMGFYEFEEVDNAKFVKMFLAGMGSREQWNVKSS
jgi:hypothetical protein